MSFREKIPVNVFTAYDELGRKYEVTEYQEFVVTPGVPGPRREPGVKTLVTSTGLPVAVIDFDTGEFEVLDGSQAIPVKRDY